MTQSTARLVSGRRVKYVILFFWLAVAVLAGPLAGKLTDVEQNEARAWLPANAESTQVLDVQSAVSDPDTIPAVVVYERRSGLTEADRTKVGDDVAEYRGLDLLDGTVVGPVPAEDGQAMQVIVPIHVGADGWEASGDVVEQIQRIGTADADGLSVHVTGPLAMAADSADAFSGLDSTLLIGTLTVVIVILLVTYRSPSLWILPVLSAGLALTASQAVVYLLAKHAGLTVNGQSAGILTVLVFGAGTDYALLITARYREELRRHEDRHEAMAVALHRAGPAIIASAATVAVGMLCLLFAEMESTKGLGPVIAIGILVGLVAMLTLLPALLVTVGRWIFWPVRPRLGTPEPSASGVWSRVGRLIQRRPRITWLGTTALLGAMAIGMVQLNAVGLSNEDSFRETPPSIAGATVLAAHFPAGSGSPVVVVTDADAASAVRSAFAGTEGIVASSVTDPVTVGDRVYLEGTLDAAPDSPAASATVDRVRSAVHAVPGGRALVGGQTAVNLDVERASDRDGRVIIPIVLGVVFLILALLLRALVAPIVLMATVVLSFAAAVGVSALVFRHVFGFSGTDASFPLFVFVFLVALGIDYNIFLMTRVREEVEHSPDHDARRAALVGLAATGGVITSAGLVLAGTFSTLATLPLVFFAEMGFAVAFGVLLDTIVVRSILVTALNLDLGPRMWWPSRLARPVAADPGRPGGDDAGEGADVVPGHDPAVRA